jgi:hypothetical protein
VIDKNGRRSQHRGRLLKAPLNNYGYPHVKLQRVHMLEMRAFFGPPTPGQEFCHWTDNKLASTPVGA